MQDTASSTPRQPATKSAVFQLRLPPDLLAQAQAVAGMEDRPLADVLRAALRDYVRKAWSGGRK